VANFLKNYQESDEPDNLREISSILIKAIGNLLRAVAVTSKNAHNNSVPTTTEDELSKEKVFFNNINAFQRS